MSQCASRRQWIATELTTALLKHCTKIKLDFTQPDATGMIPALRVGHLWRESKVHLTQLYPLFLSGKVPFSCASDESDGTTPLHSMFDQTPYHLALARARSSHEARRSAVPQ